MAEKLRTEAKRFREMAAEMTYVDVHEEYIKAAEMMELAADYLDSDAE